MISTFTAFFDANVFYGARLHSLVVYLAQSGTFRARWSEDVHREWLANLIENRPDLTPDRLRRTRELMDAAVPDCLVTGYENLVDGLDVPDPDDRHILAAAITAKASVIVTFNFPDFPNEKLAPFGIHSKHPDEFILDLGDLHPGVLEDAATEDWLHYRNPPVAFDDYLDALRRAGIPRTAEYLSGVRVVIGDN